MPRGDGTGPNGQGPVGRGMGGRRANSAAGGGACRRGNRGGNYGTGGRGLGAARRSQATAPEPVESAAGLEGLLQELHTCTQHLQQLTARVADLETAAGTAAPTAEMPTEP